MKSEDHFSDPPTPPVSVGTSEWPSQSAAPPAVGADVGVCDCRRLMLGQTLFLEIKQISIEVVELFKFMVCLFDILKQKH